MMLHLPVEIIQVVALLIPFPFYFNIYRNLTSSLVAVLAGVALLLLPFHKAKKIVKPELLDYAIIAFIVIMAFSVLKAQNMSHSLKYLVKWTFFLSIYFLVKYSVRSQDEVRKVIKAIIGSGILLCLLGLWQHFQTPETIFRLAHTKIAELLMDADTLHEHLKVGRWGVNWLLVENKAIRSFGTFTDVITFAAYLGLIIPLIIPFALQKQKAVTLYVRRVVLLLMMACLLFTYVRGAWLGCLAAMIVMMAVARDKYTRNGIGVVLVLTGLTIFSIPDFRDRFLSIINTGYSTNAARVDLWAKALSDIHAQPLLGWGIGSYGYGDPGAIPVHNNFLQIAVETGLLGMSILTLICVLAIKKAWTLAVAARPECRPYGLGLLGGMTWFMVISFFGTFFLDDKFTFLFMMLLGLAAAMEQRCGKQES